MTKATQRRTLTAFRRNLDRHERHEMPAVVEEHGGRFVTCSACGAIYSVAFDGAGHILFETIEPGDESCRQG